MLLALSILFFMEAVAFAMPFQQESGSGAQELVVPAELAAAIAVPVVFAYAGKKYISKVSWNELKQMSMQQEQSRYQKFLSAIASAAKSVASAVSSAVKTVTNVVTAVAKTVSNTVSTVASVVSNVASKTVSAVVSVAKTVASGVSSAMTVVANVASKAASAAGNIISSGLNVAKNLVSSGIQIARQMGSVALDYGKKALDMQMKLNNALIGGAAFVGKTIWDGACAVGDWVVKHPYETIMIVGMVALALTGVGLIADFAAAGTIGLGAIGASSTGAMLGSVGSGLFIASDVALGGVFAADIGTAYQDGGWDAAQTVIADKGPMVALTAAGYGVGAAIRPIAAMLTKTKAVGSGVELGETMLKAQGYTNDVIKMEGGATRVIELENMGFKAKDVERIAALKAGKIKPYSSTVMNKFSTVEVVGMEKTLTKMQIEDLSKMNIRGIVEGNSKNAGEALSALKKIDADPKLVSKIDEAGVSKITIKEFEEGAKHTPARIDPTTGEMEINVKALGVHDPKALVEHEAQHLIDDFSFASVYDRTTVMNKVALKTKLGSENAEFAVNLAEDLVVDSRISKSQAISLSKSEIKLLEKGGIPDETLLAKEYATLKNQGANADDFLSKVDTAISKNPSMNVMNKDTFIKRVEVMGQKFSEESQPVLTKFESKTMTNEDQINFASKMNEISKDVKNKYRYLSEK